jgi:hypothetical protein
MSATSTMVESDSLNEHTDLIEMGYIPVIAALMINIPVL